MGPNQSSRIQTGLKILLSGVIMVGAWSLSGCEVNSYLDSSEVGRYERTPTILPILNQLDIIDEPDADPVGLTQVTAADLVPEVREYVIGAGDAIQVTVYELLMEGTESVQQRRVDNLGMIRLPVIGAVKVSGLTAREAEDEVKNILSRKGVLRDASVSVEMLDQRQNTFSIIGEPRLGGTALGTYTILNEDFRLLDAVALARGFPGSIKTIYVYRQVELYKQGDAGQTAGDKTGGGTDQESSAVLLEQLLRGEDTGETEPEAAPEAPGMLESTLTEAESGGAWVNVGGEWVRTERKGAEGGFVAPGTSEDPRSKVLAQRIIEIPLDALMKGDMRYNIVIRPGDIISVPAPNIGNVYVMGQISRPGVYGLPGDGDLTIKNVVAAGGNLAPLAIPERVDLIRRIEKDREAWVRLNVRAIFDGTQPDIFLRPNDQLIFGTNFLALPVQVVRSGFRMSYGFGFVLDRNFSNVVY